MNIKTGTCGKCKALTPGGKPCPDCRVFQIGDRKSNVFVPKQESLPRGDFEKKYESSGYGLAFDVGTTTVVGILVNLSTGEPMYSKAEANPQVLHGADVISRIAFAGESAENLSLLQSETIGCLNDITGELVKISGISANNINEVVIVCNTAMSHIIAGVDPKPLAVAPFTPAFFDLEPISADKFGININRSAKVELLPIIAGHVGSDITAGFTASGIIEKKGSHLYIDVGTNGEIVLSVDGAGVTCSTAAGPAFEGASIYQGMRAAEGAIERVDISGHDVSISVVGGKTPVGICGSGILDAVSEAYKAGLIEKTGRLITADNALDKGVSAELAGRLREGKTGREFVLAFAENGDDVVLTQKDIREVQLSKGAIRAGIKLLLDELNTLEHDLHNIYIAGAFGNRIRTESAVGIGLIPDVGRDKVLYIGNAASIGACMALLSPRAREEMKKTAKKVRHVELAAKPSFQEEYLAAMSF